MVNSVGVGVIVCRVFHQIFGSFDVVGSILVSCVFSGWIAVAFSNLVVERCLEDDDGDDEPTSF